MKTITDPKIMQLLQRFSTIQEEAWLVGGCVRDMLMERELHDYDITTSAPPDVVIKLFQSAGYRVVPTGLKHGTVTVDRKSTRLNSSHRSLSRMPSSA